MPSFYVLTFLHEMPLYGMLAEEEADQMAERTKGFAEQGVEIAPAQAQKVELGAGGRLVIPAPMRAALGMKEGDKVLVRLEGHELRIYTYQEAMRRAQEIVRSFVPTGVSLVDELIADRRAEAAREMGDE
jgi:AbrB family looped-hinge helix DNA binding protein